MLGVAFILRLCQFFIYVTQVSFWRYDISNEGFESFDIWKSAISFSGPNECTIKFDFENSVGAWD